MPHNCKRVFLHASGVGEWPAEEDQHSEKAAWAGQRKPHGLQLPTKTAGRLHLPDVCMAKKHGRFSGFFSNGTKSRGHLQSEGAAAATVTHRKDWSGSQWSKRHSCMCLVGSSKRAPKSAGEYWFHQGKAQQPVQEVPLWGAGGFGFIAHWPHQDLRVCEPAFYEDADVAAERPSAAVQWWDLPMTME